MILVTGNIAGTATFDFADGVRKAVPDGLALSVDVPRPFPLVGSRRHAPKEPARKARPSGLRWWNCTWNLPGKMGSSGVELAVRKQRAAGSDQRSADELTPIHFDVCSHALVLKLAR